MDTVMIEDTMGGMLEYDPFLQLFNSYYLAIIVMDDM